MAVNPFLPLNEYIPDGEPHTFDGRVYLYGSHDRFNGDRYCMNDYVCYSAAIDNLTNWQAEGVIYRKGQDSRDPAGEHCLWAPDVVQGLDGRYYLYYCLDILPEIGVAVCDTPAGAYQYLGLVHYQDGTVLGRKESDYIQFDPGVFIDDDDSIYLYSGNGPKTAWRLAEPKASQVMKLKKDMLTIAEGPEFLIPTLKDSGGTTFAGHEFFEASSVRKINGSYYFIYSDINSYNLCYAVSQFPDRAYRYGGTIIALGDVGRDGRAAADARNCLGNIHGSIENIGGQWYVFYHRQTNRTMFSRQACAEPIAIEADGTIPQVEMTSSGLNQGPLEGKGCYPAAVACNLWNRYGTMASRPELMDENQPYLTQDGEDGRPHAMPYIANLKHGGTAGYKYFSFEQVNYITVEVRGNAEGKLLILAQPEGDLLGAIPLNIAAQSWTSCSGAVGPLSGDLALFFRYEGRGTIDFGSFTFRSAKEEIGE